jgi:hypothetical protein
MVLDRRGSGSVFKKWATKPAALHSSQEAIPAVKATGRPSQHETQSDSDRKQDDMYKPVQQATHACFPFGDAGHDQGSYGRPHERVEREEDGKGLGPHAPYREHEGDQHDPGEPVCHEEEEEQGMPSHYLP